MVRSIVIGLILWAAAACAPSEDPAPGGDGDSADAKGCPDYEVPVITGAVDRAASSELSGLVASRKFPGVLWTHNDGDRPVLIALDRDGTHLADIDVGSAGLTDWEELALGPARDGGPDELYLADTGDNALERESIQVIRVPEPDPFTDSAVRGAESFELVYGDGKAHDAEAMFVEPRSGRIFIVTKRADKDPKTKLFATAARLGSKKSVTLELLLKEGDAPGLDGRWVGAAITPAGDRIMLVQHSGKNRAFDRAPGQSVEDALAGPACNAPRPEGQFESIAFTLDGLGYYMVPEAETPRVEFVVERRACPGFEERAPAAVASERATELSGAAASRHNANTLWAINDGGAAATALVAFDDRGKTRAELELPDAENVSWEDIAIGPGSATGQELLYIADIGDKDRARDAIQVYRVAEPALGSGVMRADADAERIALVYGDGKAHDAEALLVHPRTGDITVITRSRSGDTATAVFTARAPFAAGKVVTLERAATIKDLGGPVTAAAMGPDGVMVLRVDGVGTVFYQGQADSTPAELATYPSCDVPGPAGGDHDAVALSADGKRLYLVSDAAMPELRAIDVD